MQSLSPSGEEGFGSSMFLTVKSFLSVRAVRSTDSMDGIDFCSSNNSTPCNLQQMTVPVLVAAMGAHYFIRDAEQYFDMAVSPDKDFYVIEGATQGGTPSTACRMPVGTERVFERDEEPVRPDAQLDERALLSALDVQAAPDAGTRPVGPPGPPVYCGMPLRMSKIRANGCGSSLRNSGRK